MEIKEVKPEGSLVGNVPIVNDVGGDIGIICCRFLRNGMSRERFSGEVRPRSCEITDIGRERSESDNRAVICASPEGLYRSGHEGSVLFLIRHRYKKHGKFN